MIQLKSYFNFNIFILDKIVWSREESLANIVAAEFIDLPLADVEGAIESEMKSKPGKII